MKDMLPAIITTLLSLVALGVMTVLGWELDHVYDEWVASSYESDMSSKILSTYKMGRAANFSNITNASAINGGMVPEGMLTGDGSTLQGPWSGSTVQLSPISGGGYQSTWTGVSAHDCAEFAASSKSDGGVIVNGTTIYTTSTNTDTVSQIANACSGASASTATVTFLYPT